MDYKRIAYGSFYDIKGRLWGVNLLRRTDSALTARELTFEGDEAAVAEWDEFDLERPIQGSALTLRIISEADREWTSLYTVNDGEVVAEVMLEGKLWWRGSLDPETYEEPYEKAKDYTVELRFSDFGPLKRHQFVVPGDGGLIKAGMAIGSNLLAIGTVTGLSADGLPSNADISSIAPPDGQTAADMLGTGAGEDAFREDEDSTDYIKAWDALSALLTASGLRMTQRAGKIVLHNLKGLRDNAGSKAEECVWSGDSQTLGADRIASRVVVSHSGEGSSNLLPVLKTGREQDVRVLSLPYGYSSDDPYNSFFLTLYETSTWQRPEKAWGFFTLRAGLDNVASTDGWMMWAYRNNRGNSPFNTAIKDHPFYTGPQTDTANAPSVAISPKTYIHLIDRPGAFNKPESGFLIKVEQEMLFDCRYNPFANDGNNDLYQKPQDTYAKTQFAYVLAELTIETASGKKYWWTNADRIYSETSISNLFACHSFDSGKWSETKAPYWIQYRTREKKEDGQIIGAGWTVNKPFVSIPNSIKWKNLKYNKVTQKLPDGDLIPLPPERGWMTLEVFAAVRFIGDGISGNAPLAAMRWILGKGARISIVDANSNFEMPESSESEVKVICNNGAEDITEVAPLLGSGGGYLGCRSLIINADGSVAEKGAPELRTASEIASQLCMRRTRLTGEAYINTTAPLSFTERLQTGRIFLLASERMDLQKGFGDRVITELVRTDIDGLEVRRNERVIFSGTADRGGRDGKDAEVYSIIPTATAVTVKSSTATDADGNVTVATEYVPAELGCSVYLTVGNDMTKTRDGILKRRITDANGKTISDVVVETDGGEAEPVAVPKGSASIEFKLLTDDSEDAMTLAICTIPVEGGNILFPDYDKDKDTLNFRTPFGDLYLRDSIDLSKYKDISISTGTGLTGGGTLEEDRTLSLDESGVKPGTYTKVTVDKYGRTTKGDTLLASDIPTLPIGKIDGLQSALDLKLNKSVFDDMFRLETVNGVKRIKALHGLYTDEYLSARGSNPDATDGTAGLDEKQLGEYLALHGYATQGWVTGKGYLTSAALTGYATQAWVEGKKYLTSHQTIRTLTIQKNGTTVDTFTPNGTANKTINLTDVASAATLSAHVADTSLHFTDALLTKLNGIEDGANNYTHPSHTATTVSAANGKVLSSITVNALGHVTAVGSKNLAAADIPSLAISKISGLQSALDAKLEKSVYEAFKAVFDDMFKLETVNGVKRIKALHGLYTDFFLSARGLNGDQAEVKAGLDEKELGDYLALHGYATQGWVTGKGYLTSAALTGYATQAWVEGKKYLTSHQTIRTLTIQKNGTTVDTFTPNGTANKTINLTDVASAATLSAHVADTSLHFNAALLTKLNGIEEGANNYTHPSHTATTISAANGKVLSSITVNALGHVTAVGSKNLAAADIPSLAISKISGLQSALDAKLEKSVYEAFKAVFDDMFRLETVNGVKRIKALHGLYTDEYLSARGLNPDAADGTAGLDEKQLGEYLALHGYATQGWVTGKGYLTSAALTGYATQAWVEGKKYLTSHQTIRTLTIQKNGTTVDTFTPNGTANKTINLTDVASAATLSAHVADTSLHFNAALLTKLNGIEDGANNYTHPSHTATTISAANGKVLSSITVNALGHVTAVGSKNLAAADIPSLDWSKITSGKPTTLAGYGISDAYTKTEADGRYVNVTGDTMTGTLTISIDTASVNHIAFTRASWNYISATQPGGILAFCTNGVSPSSSNGTLYLEGKNGRPGQNNVGSWGTSSLRWSNVYSVLGNFSGLVTAAAGIQIGDCKITWVAGKGLCFSKGIYSEEHVSARGANSAGGSGSSFGRLDDWSKYSASGSDALSAKLGYGLKTDLDSLTSRVSTLEKKNYLDALTLSVTGSGNAVTSATLSADKKTITLTKGTTFLTSHQSLANYVTLNTAQTISGVKTFSNGIKLNTATSWTAGDRVIPFSQYDDMSVIRYYSDNADKGLTFNANSGALKAGSFVKRGGTSTQFLKADGSVDATSYLPSSTYTASDILTKLKTVDGSGSGLDADLLDGKHRNDLFVGTSAWMTDTTGLTQSIEVGGNSDTYYPVVISVSNDKRLPTRISVWKNLGSKTPSISGNHSNGTSSMWLLYEGRYTAWDGNGGFFHTLYRSMPYASLCAKTEANTNVFGGLIVWLRGGGCQYYVSCTNAFTVTVALTEYTLGTSGSNVYKVAPVTELGNLGILNSNAPLYGNATTATKLQTSRTLWGQSFDGSGNVSGNLTSVGNITGSGAMTIKATGILTLNGTSGIYLKYNNDDTKSLFLKDTAFKPFDAANNKLSLGTSSARWSNLYSVLGNFSGLVTAAAGIQIGSTADIGWYANNSRITAGAGTARGVNVGSLLVSNAWADYTKVPTNGIYVKGAVKIGDCEISWDASAKMLKFSTGLYSEGAVSARGANSGGSSSGGLIQTVYGYGDLGKVFSDLTKSDTFNAYTINKLFADKADKTALTNGSVTKVGTATVGGTAKPIYLSAGTPTALSATIGSASVPIYLSAGTITQCTASSLFSSLTTSGNAISVTVAGQTRTLTVPFATKTSYIASTSPIPATGHVLTYYDGAPTIGTTSGNAFKGSSSTHTLWSFPDGGTSVSSTNNTANVQVLRFSWGTTYFHEIFTSPNYNDVWHRSVINGTAKDWERFLTTSNYTSYVTKIGTATVGSTSKPIYLNAGVPTAISATVGSATKPVYLSAGTVTACSYAFGNGSGNVPVSNGTVNTNLNADMLDGKHNGSVSAADSQWLKIITNMGYDFANVGAAKDRLAELFGTQSGGIGYAINIGASVISHWTDDSFVPVASSTYTVIKLSGTYSGSKHGTWLLASYGDTRLKVVGRTNDEWTAMRTLATTDDNVASANRLSGTTARTAWGQTFFTTGGVPQSISGNLTSVGNITGSGAMTIQSTGGRLTLNAPTTGLDLKFNNTDAKSVILNGTAFKPFDAADNALELGTDAARWKKITAVNMRLSSSTSAGGGDVYLEMWRGTNASWKVLNTGGTLKFQSNYTTAVQSTYFDCFTLAYNTGNAYLKGRLGIGNTAPSYPLDVNGNIRAQSGWLRNTGAYGWYNETYGGGWYMQDSTWIRVYGGKSVYIAAPASLKIGDCTIKYENGALHFDKGIYSDEFVSAKGLNADAGAGGLIEKVYDIDSIGKTFSQTTLTDTFNAHAIQSIYNRVTTLEGKNYLNDLNVTTTGNGNAITSATLSADKKTLTLTKGTTFATTTQLTNGSVTKVGTATVGSTSKPIYLNAGVPTALSATVGSATKPVYLSAGAITASSSTVGGTAKPMYLNAGTMTALSATVGASNQPVYLNAGTITAVSGVGIGYLSEGGPNKSGSLGPFDYIDGISASNKFEGLPGQYIKVELWNGSAWVDAGLTDAQKTSLVSYEGLTVSASQTNATSGNKIRVTITAAAGVLYFACNKICINYSYNGATNSKVLIERAHVGSETTFETLGTYGVSGWSGWNSIYFGAMNFGGSTTQTSNWRVLRFTFTADAATSDSYKTNKIAVYNILAYGKTAWSYANVLNKWGRPYTYSPSTFLSTFIGGIRPNSNNAHDLGTSAYRWNYIYGAYGNFSTSVTTTQVTSTSALLLDGTNLVTMRYNNSGLMMGVQLSAATLQPTANCAGSLSLGSSSARWNATYIKSLNVTDSMTSSKVSSTHLAANQGQAIINSTASAGSYTMLAKMNTTNGYMLIGSWLKAFRLAYTSKENVDKGTNGTDKSVNLLDEDGITTLNILKVGTNGGDFLVNGSSVSIGTTSTIADHILFRRHTVIANANIYFTTTSAGTGAGLYFAPVANGSNPYLGLMKHNNRAWAADAVRFYNDGTLWAKTGIWTDGYISARGQNTSSDVRLKKDFAPFSLRLKDIAEAPSVRFRWKIDGREDLGSIAQHFRRVSPLLTPQSPDGTLTLQYGKTALLAVIAVARKTLDHEERIARLERENMELRRELERLGTNH